MKTLLILIVFALLAGCALLEPINNDEALQEMGQHHIKSIQRLPWR